MKKSGTAGEEIINALVTNSATFGSKTEFSQEKYKYDWPRCFISQIGNKRMPIFLPL